MKNLSFFLLSTLLLGACAGKKLSQEESFLQSPPEGEARLYFYSVLPNTLDENGQFLCVLMNSFTSGGFTSLRTDIFIRYGMKGQTLRTDHYVERLPTLDEAHFPLTFLSPETSGGAPDFMHSISRSQIACRIMGEGGADVDYSVKFPKQASLAPSADRSHAEIHTLRPIPDAELRLNEFLSVQPSILCVNAIDSIDALLKSRKSKTYFWLDYVLEGKGESLFFSVDEAAQFTVHFNTLTTQVSPRVRPDFPSPKPPLDQANTFLEFEWKGASYALIQIDAKPCLAQNPFWMGAVAIRDMESQKTIALGNLLVL